MVQWKETCMVRYRESFYSDEDVSKSWYTEDDIVGFKAERKEIKKLVKKFASMELFEKTLGDHYSCHGLEKYISHSKAKLRRERIQECLETVKAIQTEQRAVEDPQSADELIAKAYRKMSAPAQKEAIARALVYMARSHQGEQQQQQIKLREESGDTASSSKQAKDSAFKQHKGTSPMSLLSLSSFSAGLVVTKQRF